jgi:RND family efflux transporter MFP subunit
VRAAKIESASLNTYTKIHGDVVSAMEVKVYPSVAGKLLERKVALGQRVQQGTVLATVDPSKVGQTYLPNPVESPLAGTVLSIPINPGDTISTNTVIATVGDLTKLRISTAVSERYVSNLKIGTNAEVSFDALPGVVFNAKVSELSPVIDPSSRTRDVKLSLVKTDPRILPGMFATIKLVIESRNNVLVVPRTAVTLSSQGAYVFVVDEKSDGIYVAKRKDVELGLEGEEFFELLSGLASGESVVTEGRSVVTDGDTLRLVGGMDGASL